LTGSLTPASLSCVSPIAEQLELPTGYGSPSRLLDWASVEQRLVDSPHYWLATVRRDGTPHVVPVDGIWFDGGCYFGGDPATVHIRNLRRDGRASMHLDEEGDSAVIVEGTAEWMTPSKSDAQRLAATATAKYGYSETAGSYLAGVWRLKPVKVLAWTRLYADATRFRFEASTE
jgi:Pyridoxamine 5'-phosphate oxidase